MAGNGVGEARGQPPKVADAARGVETDEICPEQPLDDPSAPRELHEQLGGRERDVQEEPDAQVGPQLPQRGGEQLQLVVLDPDRGVPAGDLGHHLGESLVDADVGLPPVPVERGRRDHVVVQRPERAVGEALVVVLDLTGGQTHRVQLQAVLDERLDVGVGQPGPADPGAVAAAQHRLEGGDEATGAALPALRSVGQLFEVDR